MNLTAAIARGIADPLSLSLTRAGVPIWTPRRLFAAGEQGAWYDPSDLSTLFQDSAGTTPVTTTGQPVGLMRDKSGRGNHASQTTATSRPLLQQDAGGWYYLAPDGVDDSLTFNVGGISAGLSMFAAVQWAGTGGQFIGVTDTTWQKGSLYFRNSTTQRYAFACFAAASASLDFAVAAAEKAIIGGIGTLSGTQRPYRNGVAGASNAAGSMALIAQQWSLFGAQGGVGPLFGGRFYGGVMVSRALGSAEIGRVNSFLANKSGVTL